MRVKVKKAVVLPTNIQEVVDRVVGTPFEDLPTVLRGFKWTYDKGDINHWVAVLDYFDSFLEQQVSQRSDVQLYSKGEAPDPPFPSEACLAVLNTTCVLLENCSNKAAYNSSEHLTNLLAAPVPEVAAAALQTFQVLVRKTHHTSVRWTPPAGLTQRLLSLSKGWGGKEEGLDLVVCASSDETAIKKVLHKATTLHFEFSSSSSGDTAEVSSSRSLTTIHIPNLDSFTESEHQILAELVRRYKVPVSHRFELLCRVRIARGFGTLAGRRQLVKQRLLAFNVLVQCSPTAEEYNALYLAEPEFVSELVGLVQAEEAVPEETLRTLALRALAAQLHDRSRISSVIAAVTSGGQSGLLSMLLHKSIASILQQADVPLAPSGSGVLPADVATAAAAAAAAGQSCVDPAAAPTAPNAGISTAAAAAPPVGCVQYSVAFVDALLSVVAALVQSSSGYQALNDAGVVAALLPLMRDLHPDHLGLVCTNLRILEAYMDLSQSAATMFRDLGGLTEMIKRLAYEVGVLPPPGHQPRAADSDVVMASADQSPARPQQHVSTETAAAAAATGSSDIAAAAPVKQLSHNRKALLKYLLRIVALSSYSPSGNVAATRPQDEDAQLLFASLKAMYNRPEEFGGSLFSLAVSVMTDLIHHEPQSFRQLNEAGLPDAFLAAIKAGVLPSGDAVVSIPSALVALCLNTNGLRRVRETAVLNVLIDIFTSKKTLKVLTSDTPAVLGSGLEELLRFVPSLRGEGVDVVIGVFKALCILGGDEEETAAALKPLPAEAPAAAAPSGRLEPAASTAGSNTGGPGPSAAVAEAAPQPMDTDVPAAPAAGAAAAGAPQDAPAEAGQAAAAAAGGGPAGAGTAAELGADGMDVDEQPAQPAPPAPEQAAAEPAAGAAQPTEAGAQAAAGPSTPAAAAQQQEERDREREQQRQEDARLANSAKRALAESLEAVAKRSEEDPDLEAFLPLALTAASRMLEPLLTNAETSRQFVERGGADVLLKIYQLPKLTPQFNFSSASHSLLSVFRALSGSHGQAIAARSKDAVAHQVAVLLPMAQSVGPVCVPTLPAEARDKYVKQLLVVQGLVQLTSAVARNVTAMLPQVSMGSPPLLASMGKLERLVMVQAAASDPWKQARDVARKAVSAVAAGGADGAGAEAASASAAVAPTAAPAAQAAAPAPEAAAGAAAAGGADGGPADAAEPAVADEEMEAAGVEGGATPEAGDAAVAATSSTATKQKRTPEDIAFESLIFLLTSLRTFYMGTSKAVHTPARRREEQAAVPTVPMKAAALNLALLMVGNFQLRPWEQYNEAEMAAAATSAAGITDPMTSKCTARVRAATEAIRGRAMHYVRLTEELNQVLFDHRRRYCHLLILNYFSALGGMKVFAAAFHDAAQLLWELIDAQEAAKAEQEATATGDQAMADAQPGAGSIATGSTAAGPSGGVTGSSSATLASGSGLKDPRSLAEAIIVKMLSIYEQLANANLLLSVPQAVNMLLAPLPNYAGQPLVPPANEPLQFVQQLHSDILAAVLPLWSHPRAAHAPIGVLTALVRVLQTCAQGPSHANLVLRYSQRTAPTAARVQPQPDPQLVQQIIEMGFSQARAEEALRRVGANSVELAMEWLIMHPEEPAAPAAAGGATGAGGAAAAAAAADEAGREEEELTRALLASLSVVGMSPDAVAQRSQQQQPAQQQQQTTGQPTDVTVASAGEPGSPVASTAHTGPEEGAAQPRAATPAAATAAPDADEVTTPQQTPMPVVQLGAPVLGVAPAAAVVGTAVELPTQSAAEGSAESATTGIPAPDQLVDGAIHLVAASPSTAFSIADLLVTMAGCEDGKDRAALVQRLMDDCLPRLPPKAEGASSSAAAEAAVTAADFPAPGADVLTPARLLLLLLHRDTPSRKVAGNKGLVQRALVMLQNWQRKYCAAVQAHEQAQHSTAPAADASSLDVPVWVEAVLLLLGLMATTQAKLDGSRLRAAAAAAVRGAREAQAGRAARAAREDVQMADQADPAVDAARAEGEQPAAAVGASGAVADATAAGTAAAEGAPTAAAAPGGDALPQELSRLPGLDAVLDSWKPCGMLEDEQQTAAVTFCLTLLQHLHDHADTWERKDTSMFEADGSLPNPGALTQGVLQLLDHLTKRYSNAQQVLAAGGHKLLLSLPSACLAPSISRQEGPIGSILRHLLEDPSTLEAWMESEIKNSMALKGVRDPYTGRSLYSQANPLSRYTTTTAFLQLMSTLVQREPAVFLQAVARTCTLDSNRGGDTMIRLKTTRELQEAPSNQLPSSAGSREPTVGGGASAGGVAASKPAPTAAAGADDRAAASAADQPAVLATPKPTEKRGSASGDKAAAPKSAVKPHKKLVPANFVDVIDALLDVVMSYTGASSPQHHQQQAASGPAAMELDQQPAQQQEAGASPGAQPPAASAPAVAAAAGGETAPLPADLLLRRLSPLSREVGIQAMVLRLLGDFCLLYSNTVGLLLKRDSEGGPADQRLPHHHSHQGTPGPHQAALGSAGASAASEPRSVARRSSSRHKEHSSSGGQHLAEAHKAGVVLQHIMHVQLVDQLPAWVPATSSVSANASSLLQAVCIRSAEGRRRILQELVAKLTSSIHGTPLSQQLPGGPSAASNGPLPAAAAACITLMGALVTSSSTPNRSDPHQPTGSSMSLEVVRAMREAGAVKALAQALKLINTEHPKARDTINAILKPLEVLTRPLHKPAASEAGAATGAAQAPDTHAVADQGNTAAAAAAAAAAGAGTTQAGGAQAAATPSAAGRGATGASRQRGTAVAGQGTPASRSGSAAATAGTAAAGGNAGAARAEDRPQPGGGGSGGGAGGSAAAMDEDRRQQVAGEEAAGPAALAAAGRFVPGGVDQQAAQGGGGLIDNLMDQLVDIEVDLNGSDDDESEGDSEGEEGSSGSEAEGGSDEHMQEGMAAEEAAEAAVGGGSEGAGMDEDPSLTEEESGSQSDEGPVFIEPGDVAGAHQAVHHGDGMDDHSDGSITDEEDDEGHEGHEFDADEEAAFVEDELRLMQEQLDAQPQEDGVVPMDDDDDDDDEEDEEEEEYLDEASEDNWADANTIEPFGWEAAPPPGARGHWATMQDGLLDGLPPLPSMRVDFGRMPGRRLQGLRAGAAPAAAAGVWDDMGDGVDGLTDPMMLTGPVQMMLNQLAVNAGGPNNLTIGGRQFRLNALDGVDLAAATGNTRAASEAVNGAMNTAMQSLTLQLLPQQHRLLALPPRVAPAESAALLEAASQQHQPAPAPASAAGDSTAATDATIRGQASSVSTLSRLVTRTNEAAPASSYLRDGRGTLISARHPGTGGLINVAINPTLLSPALGPGSSLWQTLEALGQPGGLLAGGNLGLGDLNESAWDEAVNQLLEVLAPNGVGRSQARLPGGLAPPGAAGRATAAGGADNAGLDPRSLESHMTALLRSQAPPAPAPAAPAAAVAARQRGGQATAAAGAAQAAQPGRQASTPERAAAAGGGGGGASGAEEPAAAAAAAAPAPVQQVAGDRAQAAPAAAAVDQPSGDAAAPQATAGLASAAASAPAPRRPQLTEQLLADALRAALQDAPPSEQAGGGDGAGPSSAAAQQQQQQEEQEHAAAAQRLASHPVDVPTSAGESPTAEAAAAAADDEEAAPMDTDSAQQQPQPSSQAHQQQQQEGEQQAGGPTAMDAEPTAAAAPVAAAGGAEDPLQAALRQAAVEAEIDLAFLEALPDELRVELLAARGVELRLPQPSAAPRTAAAPAAAAAAPGDAAGSSQPPAASQPAAEGEAAASGEVAGAAAAVGPPAAVAVAAPAGGPDGAEAPAAPDAAPAEGAAAPPAAEAAPAAAADDDEPQIDPEFLAALPDDIRQEVLAQQRAQQRARAAAARAAEQNRQPDMTLADLLAAMPDDVRADALAQLNDDDLAQLPPQTRAEAQALRENAQRAMRQMQQAQQAQQQAQQQQHEMFLQQNLGGGPGRLRLAPAPPLSMLPEGLPSRLFGNQFRHLGPGGRLGPRGYGDAAAVAAAARAANAAAEPEGPPPLDEADLAVLISLLRTSLPLSKQHLQKLFLNLAAYSSSREQLLKMLLSLLRGLPGTSSVAGSADADDEPSDSQQTGGSGRGGMDISEDGSSQQQQQQQQQQGLSAALDRLGAADQPAAGTAAVADSGAAGMGLGLSGSPQGKPAVVSRRVLDMLSYLARNSSSVSRQMLSLRVPEPHEQAKLEADARAKGKMVVRELGGAALPPRSIEVLLMLLSAPLCQRSVSLLEQLMLLMEVMLTMVQRYEADTAALAALEQAQEQQRKAEAERKRQREQQQREREQRQQQARQQQQQPQSSEQQQQPPQEPSATEQEQQQRQQEAQQPTSGGPEPMQQSPTPQQQQPHPQQEQPPPQQQQESATQQQRSVELEKQQQQPKKQQQPAPNELATTIASIPPNLLRQLPGLLAREVLSEPAYASIAKVIKLIVESAPIHLPLMLSELVEGAGGVADALLGYLDTAAQRGIDADAQLAPAIGTKSSVVLRMLYALQGFQSEVQERLKRKREEEEEEQRQQQQAATEGTTAAAGPSSSSAAAGAGSSAAGAAGPSSSAGAGASTSAAAAAAAASGPDAAGAAVEVDKAIAAIAARTAPLWKSLSSCILRIEDNLRAVLPQHTQAGGESVGNAAARLLPPGAQQVLPLVEAFFVLCALQGAIPATATPLAKDLLAAPSLDLNTLMPAGTSAGAAVAGSGSSHLWRPGSSNLGEAGASGSSDVTLPFLKFAERHRRLLNAYIRRNTSLLESSLAPLLHVPKLIDFDNKRAYFRSKVRSPDDRAFGSLRLNVKRQSVFEDSFNKLRSKTPAEMRAKLSVSFVGEEGIDAGGVSREWYQVMAREIFNPNLALFVSVPEGGTTFQPNPNSIVQSDTGVSHLEFFKFVGRLVGKALYDGQLMDAYFTRSFYKHMLGQPLTYEDIEAVDPEYYKNLKWMLEHDITDVLDLTFTAESDFFGKTEVLELVPGGRDIKVTQDNKHEYVNLIARHRMTTSIKPQIQAFTEGFWQLVPRELITIFNDHELELLISGLPDIDVSDLRANTHYSGYSPASPVIQWFWQVVAEMEKQDLALLLQFVTGTSKVPLNGFRALQGISGPQKFQIHKSYGAGDRLPSAHTCFNQLDLPEYESKEQLAERLMMAIHEGHEGFGFG